MNKTALALLDITGLLAEKKRLFGDAVMTAPTGDPALDDPAVLRVPPAPPAPPAPVTQVDLNDPAVIAAIEKARQQEKDKLYSTIEGLQQQVGATAEQVAQWQAEREEREKREQEAIAAAAAAEEEKRLAELSFSERLAEVQKAQDERFASLQDQLQQRDAVLAKERQFTELMQYRNAALENTDNPEGPGRGLGPQILPQLRELVTGNSREEIDASVSALAERSTSILQEVAQAQGVQRQQARGVGVTAPPVGPLDNNSGYETVSAADIAAMDMPTYAANRGRLLGAASQQQQGRGMFG